ncbi:hypothetical protein CLU79DRAFT_715503 [Phycomyces nitens]|nr:hypothetical protein CLU79DRAFT_715503 [Phycomyces nitens]
MSTTPPKIPKPYTTIKDYKTPDRLRQALELPCYLFTGELQNWGKIPELLDAYFKASVVIEKNGHALLNTITSFLKKIENSEETTKAVQNYCARLETFLGNKSVKNQFMGLYGLKEIEWREKRSKDSLSSETRIASNTIIAKRIQEVGEQTTSKEPSKKQKIEKYQRRCVYLLLPDYRALFIYFYSDFWNNGC